MALRPKAPKLSSVPPLALPWMRPLKALRNLVRLGCSIVYSLPVAAFFARRPNAGSLGFHHQPILSERVVTEDLALEDPHLDAAHAVGGVRFGFGIIDVAAQRVQRNAALAVPFGAGDLGAAETARAGDADPFRAKAQRRLDGALHCPAKGNAALELVGDTLSDELGVDLRLSDLNDVQADVGARHLLKLILELFDVGALLADDHARTSGIDADAADLRRTFDHDLADRRLRGAGQNELPDLQIFEQQPPIILAFREPAAVPGPVDLQAKPDR